MYTLDKDKLEEATICFVNITAIVRAIIFPFAEGNLNDDSPSNILKVFAR